MAGATRGRAAGPLAGVGVIVTRPVRQAAALVQRLAAYDGHCIVWPAIVILPPADAPALARAHECLGEYDAAVFVSANAVEFGAPDPLRWPRGLPIYAPGAGTAAAIDAVGLPAAHVPTTSFDSDGLLALPGLQAVAGRRIVVFRGEDGRAQLGDTLRARGARVDYVDCYQRAAPRAGAAGLAERIDAGDAHALSLTSAEGLRNLLRALDATPARARLLRLVAFAGHPRIAAAARAEGLDAHETPPGDGGLVAALLEWFGAHPVNSKKP